MRNINREVLKDDGLDIVLITYDDEVSKGLRAEFASGGAINLYKSESYGK